MPFPALAISRSMDLSMAVSPSEVNTVTVAAQPVTSDAVIESLPINLRAAAETAEPQAQGLQSAETLGIADANLFISEADVSPEFSSAIINSTGVIKVTSTAASGMGSLYEALEDADQNDNSYVLIDARDVTGTIDLTSDPSSEPPHSLPTLTGSNHIWVVGNDGLTIDGGGSEQILSVNKSAEDCSDCKDSGFVAFFNVKFARGIAKGGSASGGGGGGLGAGGALFINKGDVIVDQSGFSDNQAIGGISAGKGGTGGSSEGSSGSSGSQGGEFNFNAKLTTGSDNSLLGPVGAGGQGGSSCDNKKGCPAATSQHGNWDGTSIVIPGFGAGGGSGGGGGSAKSDNTSSDAGGDGGDGGDGGWGGGGGGGGGGGSDHDAGCIGGCTGEAGAKGDGGDGGTYGGNGSDGEPGNTDYGNKPGGDGGGGAGLGGAIFVRESNGGILQLSSSDFSNNSAIGGASGCSDDATDRICGDVEDSLYNGAEHGSDLFVNSNDSDHGSPDVDSYFGVQEGDETTDEYVTGRSTDLPALALSLENLNGDDISAEGVNRVYEGDRINLKVSSINGQTISAGTEVYFYLSKDNALAQAGNGLEQGTDFSWDENGKIFYGFTAPSGSQSFYINIPNTDATNALGNYSGIQTFIDKLLEGDEDLVVDLLLGPGYRLATNADIEASEDDPDSICDLENTDITDIHNPCGYRQEIIIEDINYQVEFLGDNQKPDLCDAADALESEPDTYTQCDASGTYQESREINVDAIKGLGYATVQLKRPVNDKDFSSQEQYLANQPSDGWDRTSGQFDTSVNGDFFNNALAGGLPIHYIIDSSLGNNHFTNQLNYNNDNYDSIGSQIDSLENAQIFNAVVIPVTEEDGDPPGDLPPGATRIYFSALPDAVKEDPETYTLTLTEFPNDPSYDLANLCTDAVQEDIGGEENCDAIDNTPDGDYKFYTIKTESDTATFTVYDSDEFVPSIIIADDINKEVVVDIDDPADDTDNPLTVRDDEAVFWVKLGSQPIANVTVYAEGTPLTFTSGDWYTYQPVTVSEMSVGDTISVTATSSDANYRGAVDRTLTLANAPTKLKITEGNNPDVSQRTVTLNVTSRAKTFTEGAPEMPGFIVRVGQPLPQETAVIYAIDEDGKALSTGTVIIPAYRQSAEIVYPVVDDSITSAEKVIGITLKPPSTNGVSFAPNGYTASFILKDNDEPTVLISQHLPDRPGPTDIANFISEIEILGQDTDDELLIQNHDPRLKDIVIKKQDTDRDLEDTSTSTAQGLLKESALVEIVPTDRIHFPENSSEAEIITEGFQIETVPAGTYARLRGTLIAPADADDYSFTVSSGSTQTELWFNPVDTFSQNKGLISQNGNISDLYQLEAGQEYYIEALAYQQDGDGASDGSLSVEWTYTGGGNGIIPVQYLKPAALDNGFIVQTWDGIAATSIDEFIAEKSNSSPSMTKVLANELDFPEATSEEQIGREINAVLTAPETGYYTFAIASDGDSQMRLLGDNLLDEPIAYVDGSQPYGTAHIEAFHTTAGYTRPKVTLTRAAKDEDLRSEWTLEYDVDEGTAPYGANSKLTLYDRNHPTDSSPVCDAHYFISSDVLGSSSTDSKIHNNLDLGMPPSSEGCIGSGREDLGVYEDYSGYDIEFVFEDRAGYFNSTDYKNFVLDGHPHPDLPDYPAYQQWDWSNNQSEPTEAQQKSKSISDPIYLEGGKRYGLEVLQINEDGPDYLSVAWQPPSADEPILLSADDLSLSQVNVPIRLIADGNSAEENPDDSESIIVPLQLSGEPINLLGESYVVESITLAGAPVEIDESTGEETLYTAPGKLNFTSGFIGALTGEAAMVSNSPSDVTLTPQDIPTDPNTLNLTVGQQGRLGFQLASQPDAGTTIEVALDEIPYGSTVIDLSSDGPLQFNSTNWNDPKYITVTAMAAGVDDSGNYTPDSSYVELTATATTNVDTRTGENSYTADSIKIQIFPDHLEEETIYFVKANGDSLNTVTFGIEAIEAKDDAGSTISDWTWTLDPDSGDLFASNANGDELVRLTPHLFDVPSGTPSEPVPLSAKATVDANIFDTSVWQGDITITGITLEAAGTNSTAIADVNVTLRNGQPTLEVLAQQSGNITTSTPTSISYEPENNPQSPIVAGIGETLVTESGELRVDAVKQTWFYEPNPRPQPDNLVFTVVDGTNSTEDIEIDLSGYNDQVQIATGFASLPDFDAPLVTITTDQTVGIEEDAPTVTATVTLDSQATQDINVYYSLDTPGKNDPGNIALDLSPVSVDGHDELNQPRALELGESGLPLSADGLTAEMWLRPTALSGTQGLLVADTGTLLELNGSSLEGLDGFSKDLTGLIASDTWFHVAYTVSDTEQTLYVNGQKQSTTNSVAMTLPEALTAIGRASEGSNYFDGAIDEVRIWNTVRTDTQIQNSYTQALATNDDDIQSQLIGYWTFNSLTLANKMDETTPTELENEDGDAIAIQDPAVQAAIWQLRQAVGPDDVTDGSTSISGFSAQQHNLLNLEATQLGGRTTFAVADFDQDSQPDVALVDGSGSLWLYRNQGVRNGQPMFTAQNLDINLGDATPITAGDRDGDGDLDLLVGTVAGGVNLIENTGNQRLARFRAPQPLLADGKALSLGSLVAPTLADLNGDGVPELVTLGSDGQMKHFDFDIAQASLISGMYQVFRSFLSNVVPQFILPDFGNARSVNLQLRDAVLLPRLPRLESAQQGYMVQFIDLDRDGDQDLLIDFARNRSGQLPGGHRYFENYGTAQQPYFVEAPHSNVATFLRNLDRDVTYGTRTIRHPYDQVEFYSFTDWDGDGDLDLFQSDNKGLIHLRSNNNFGFVSIAEGDSEATITLPINDDNQAETTEFIQLRLVEGNPAQADYHTEQGSDLVVIEIEDNDIAGIQILDPTPEVQGNEIINPETDSIDVSETPTTLEQYQVQLTSQPTTDVYLKIASSDPQQGLVAKQNTDESLVDIITLRFTSDDWNRPQDFYVGGADDQVDDDNASFGYVFVTKSADRSYGNQYEILTANSVNNDDEAQLNFTFESLPEAAVMSGGVTVTEGQINTVKVALNSQPTEPVMLTLAPEDGQLTFYPQRRIRKLVDIDPITRRVMVTDPLLDDSGDCTIGEPNDGTSTNGQFGTLCWREDGAYTYTQSSDKLAETTGQTEDFSYVIDNGYGSLSSDSLSIRLPFFDSDNDDSNDVTDPITRQGSLFFNVNSLAGQSMELTFTPDDWNLERTVAVAAVDDDLVEYNHDSHINVLLANPAQMLYGTYGLLDWNADGSYTYALTSERSLDVGTYVERPFYFTQADDTTQNHTLNLVITVAKAETSPEDEEYFTNVAKVTYAVTAYLDQDAATPTDLTEDSGEFGHFPGSINSSITGMSVDRLDPVYLAALPEPLTVNIEDNDLPIVRAGVDLDAGENTHPGYFTLSVAEPVGEPGGLPVGYTIYGFESSDYGATAETQPPAPDGLQDPGPDFQGYDTLSSGTLSVPTGKTRVSFPIFPIDDFTPEESLAARYEKVVVDIQDPQTAGLPYVLDQRYPDTQTAAVRILDNEEVGLKVVIPADGLAIDEGSFNGFRVGLKSQPQTEVELKFYYDDVEYAGRRDLTFLDIDTVTFDTNDWNQWKSVDVRLFNNLVNNEDDIHPRYTDLYFTLLDNNDACDGDGNNDAPKQCEPFYNTAKGALNLTTPDDANAKEPKILEGQVTKLTGSAVPDSTISATGTYGTVTLTDVDDKYLGDFEYHLTSDTNETIIQDISASGTGKVLDVFDYEIEAADDRTYQQKLAVEIQALNSTNLSSLDDGGTPAEMEVIGDYGTLNITSDGNYFYELIENNLPTDENWTVHDSYVYTLKTPDTDGGESFSEDRYALNIDITQEGEFDRYAWVNGKSIYFDAEVNAIFDSVIKDGINSDELLSDGAAAPLASVVAVGQTTLTPVVTNMYLQDASGDDLRVIYEDGNSAGNELIVTNPLFKANHINTVEDLQVVDDTLNSGQGASVFGSHGTLYLQTNGFYTYTIDPNELSAGLNDVDERVVNDRFRYHLSNGADGYLELVTIYENETQTVTVQGDGITLDTSDNTSFEGSLFESDELITAELIGPAHSSIFLRETPLDPFVISEGLKMALGFLQSRFYDASVPVMGRMGGGGTGDTSGSSDGAKVPSFADRLLSVVESEITKQPNLTATDLERVFKLALQSIFGEYGVPLQVLALDTEKILLKLTFGNGASAQTDAYETDWGMPGMGHFAGQAQGTAKYTFDLVFGIKFKAYTETSGGAHKWAPKVFIVTDQTTLDYLLDDFSGSSLSDTVSTTTAALYPIRTWAGSSILQEGVVFLDKTTAGPEEPTNNDDLNGTLRGDGLELDWQWKPADPKYTTSGKRYDEGTIVGVVKKTGGNPLEVKLVEISLKQPTTISANKVANVEVSATLDPNGYLLSNSSKNKKYKEQLNTALATLAGDSLEFSQHIKAVDTNGRESQELTAEFSIRINQKTDSTPLNSATESYSASIEVDVNATKPDDDFKVPDEADVLIPVSTTYKDIREVMTTCDTSNSNRCKPQKVVFDIIKGGNNNSGNTKKSFAYPPSDDMDAFKNKTSASYKLQTDDGEIKITGTLQKSGSTYKVKWTWEFSAGSSESIKGWNNGFKDVELDVYPKTNSTSSKTHALYTLSQYPVLFMEPGKNCDQGDLKFEAVSKLTAEISGSVDFQGDAQLYVLGGSINQAASQPINPVPSSNSEDPQIEPAQVYQELVGHLSDRDRVVEITADNADNSNPAYIVGKYGTLALAQDGSYSYSLKEDLLEETYTLSCTDDNAAHQALCQELLKTDENDNPVYWPSKTGSAPSPIEFKGYVIDCQSASYSDVSGSTACTVSSPNVLLSEFSNDDLILTGVPNLETAITPLGEGLSGWEAVPNLTSYTDMKTLYGQIQSGGGNTSSGVAELKDEFFISAEEDRSFRTLAFTIDSGPVVQASFDSNSSVTLTGDNTTGWTTTKPLSITPLQASPGKINPMAKVRTYLDIALKDLPKEVDYQPCPLRDGILFLDDLDKGVTQFTLGGDASLYAEFNAGIGAPPVDDDDSDDGYELPLPSVIAKIGLISHYEGTTDVSNVASRGGEFVFGIYDMGLDLGSFISDKLVGPLSHLGEELEPIQPIASALTKDMQIFSTLGLEETFDQDADGRVTVLEIPTPFLDGTKGEKYAAMLKQADTFLEFIAGILEMIKISSDLGDELAGVKALSEQVVSSDGYLVAPEDIRISPLQDTSDMAGVSVSLVPYVNQLGHIIIGSDKGYQYTKTLNGAISTTTVKEVKPKKPAPAPTNTSSNSSMNKVKKRTQDLQDRGIITFPILTNPWNILQLIFGDPAELIVLDVPDLDINFLIDKSFRIYPPLSGIISGSLEMLTDVDLGVDTAGLLSAACGSDTPGRLWDCQGELSAGERAVRLLNSIYIQDWTPDSYSPGGDTAANHIFWHGFERPLPDRTVFDKHELAGNAEIDVGAGFNIVAVSSYFKGGPGLGGGVDLVDLCEATTPEPCEPIDNGSFTASGNYDGKLRAYDFAMQLIDDPLSVFDIGFTFYVDFEAIVKSFGIEIWNQLIAYFPLYEFGSNDSSLAVRASKDGSPIVGGTLFFDANGNGLPDGGEPLGFTDSQGRAVLRVPYQFFDKNGDGVIDDQDGRIVLLDGVDSQTGKAGHAPLVSLP
ncbi:MAG: LamG domain-containing protein [Cyanobacteria bacterium P01_B01_bin.77]